MGPGYPSRPLDRAFPGFCYPGFFPPGAGDTQKFHRSQAREALEDPQVPRSELPEIFILCAPLKE